MSAVHTVRGSVLLAACALAGTTTPARADLPPLNEVLETILGAQTMDALFLTSAFGLDPTTRLAFTVSGVGSVTGGIATREFAYALLPGQTYQGLPITLRATATYNAGLARYEWTKIGQLGATAWSATGTAFWLGDPETIQAEVVMVGQTTYDLTGTGEVNPDFERGNVSTAQYTLTPRGGGAPRTCTGPDRILAGGVFRSGAQCVTAQKDTLDLSNVITPDAQELPFQFRGTGSFDIRAVPEPTPLALAVMGMVGVMVVAAGWPRRGHQRARLSSAPLG